MERAAFAVQLAATLAGCADLLADVGLAPALLGVAFAAWGFRAGMRCFDRVGGGER